MRVELGVEKISLKVKGAKLLLSAVVLLGGWMGMSGETSPTAEQQPPLVVVVIQSDGGDRAADGGHVVESGKGRRE